MSAPLFITKHPELLENWQKAFPQAQYSCGLPEKYEVISSEPIFVDFLKLTAEEKTLWLASALSTDRQVVVLSPTPTDVEALQVVKAGAVGYAHSHIVPAKLKQVVTVIQQGGLWLGSQLIRKILLAVERTTTEKLKGTTTPVDDAKVLHKKYKDLSEREVEVAQLVAKGATNQEISDQLGIKERTVKAHITSSFKKLKVRNRVELALLLHNIQLPRDSNGNSSKQHAL